MRTNVVYSELCDDCTVANEIDYEIDYAWWTSIHDNGHVITACDYLFWIVQVKTQWTDKYFWSLIKYLYLTDCFCFLGDQEKEDTLDEDEIIEEDEYNDSNTW